MNIVSDRKLAFPALGTLNKGKQPKQLPKPSRDTVEIRFGARGAVAENKLYSAAKPDVREYLRHLLGQGTVLEPAKPQLAQRKIPAMLEDAAEVFSQAKLVVILDEKHNDNGLSEYFLLLHGRLPGYTLAELKTYNPPADPKGHQELAMRYLYIGSDEEQVDNIRACINAGMVQEDLNNKLFALPMKLDTGSDSPIKSLTPSPIPRRFNPYEGHLIGNPGIVEILSKIEDERWTDISCQLENSRSGKHLQALFATEYNVLYPYTCEGKTPPDKELQQQVLSFVETVQGAVRKRYN